MKKILLIIIAAVSVTVPAFPQVKIALATKQKTYGGMGGIFMNYTIGIKNKTADSLVIDSIKTIADTSSISYYFNKTEKTYCELAFSYTLDASTKCRTCPDVIPKQSNLTKGVIVYYRKGNKKHLCKVKKFKQLPNLMLP